MGGQARKSLWIETYPYFMSLLICRGQARKSLWIETSPNPLNLTLAGWVRLVRACGSKQLLPGRQHGSAVKGQARKSLWIETD